MAENYDKAKTRTCKPAWDGLKYIPATARHWSSELITDEQAQKLLNEGHLREIDFQILPGKTEPQYSEGELNCIIEIAEALKAGTTKKSLREKYKDVELIGEKPCNAKLINELIKEAEKSL